MVLGLSRPGTAETPCHRRKVGNRSCCCLCRAQEAPRPSGPAPTRSGTREADRPISNTYDRLPASAARVLLDQRTVTPVLRNW
jgi:hypothetical protein